MWIYFDEVGTKAVCKHCSMEFVTGANSGTTHLRRHINVCQKIDEEEGLHWAKARIYLVHPIIDLIPTRSLMTLLFIDAEIPFHVIESRFWEPAMRSLRPEYRAVKRQTLRNDCVGGGI